MSSAKTTIRVQDRSQIVPSLPGVKSAVHVVTRKGPIGVPILVGKTSEFIRIFGEPDPSLGSSAYAALTYLTQGNSLWVSRAIHDDAKYAAATVRWKIDDLATGYPAADYEPDRIVNPILGGLTKSQLASYQFEVSSRAREYSDPEVQVTKAETNDLIRVDGFGGLEAGHQVIISAGLIGALVGTETKHDIEDTVTIEAVYTKITLDGAVDAAEGAVIEKVEAGPTYTAYTDSPVIGKSSSASTDIFVLNADYIQPGDTIRIGGAGGDEAAVVEKNYYAEDTYYLQLGANVTVAIDDNVYRLTEDEFEEKDALLVHSVNPSLDWNKISIGIAPSTNYDNAFNILVYFDGVLEETWEVTRTDFLDGYRRQMNMEDKINGKSQYIGVIGNPDAVDPEDVPHLPLATDYSVWRRNPDDIFVTSTLVPTENIIQGDTQVQFGVDPAGISGIEAGARVKFITGDDIDGNIELSAEYKIDSVNSVSNFIVLDREIVEEQISLEWVDYLGSTQDTLMYFFDEDNNDAPNGITDGVQYYTLSTIDNTYYNYPLNAPFTISGNAGVLLDPGANLLTGSTLGSAVTVSDINNAYDLLKNGEKTPTNLMLDGGATYPAVAQKVSAVVEEQLFCHGYLSMDPIAEQGANFKQDMVDYNNSLALDTDKCSIFAGWIKIQDDYNQKEIFVSPEAFGAASQSFTTRNYNFFTPAAGWLRGKVAGLDVQTEFDQPTRDFLVENRINPIRKKEGSLVIWGNETLLSRPSPLQIRSVSMLIIAIKYGLQNYLENKHFDFNSDSVYTQVEKALTGFMRDEIQGKGGVTEFQISVKEIITDSDKNLRKMPVFVGIKPTPDINEIPVTLAIYNQGANIDVSV